ncbi:hypothetical protein ACWFRK_40155, partial [Streptomyces sp. NPDC055157]
MNEHLHTALYLAADGLPALPLREGKVPFGNCPTCAKNACGGGPNMKIPGHCFCPAPRHGWAAGTTDLHSINSTAWARAWREAAAVVITPPAGTSSPHPQEVCWRRRSGARGGLISAPQKRPSAVPSES